MKSWFKRAQPVALAVGLATAIGACDEKLDTGLACPLLCPHQQVTIRDTVFEAVELDSSIAGFPPQGSESAFFIASMGDTLETMAIVRYDSLPTTFRFGSDAQDSVIYAVDSARIRMFLSTGDTLGPPVTIEVYDVDMGGPDDSDPNAVATAFTPDRLLGSRTIPGDSIRDSASVFIDNARLLAKIQADSPTVRLRIGIKVNPAGGTNHVTVKATETGNSGPQLIFRPHTNTAVAFVSPVQPLSKFPSNPYTALALADYLFIAREPAPAPADVLRVGGLPGRRVYLRFDIPDWLIDSSNVVRATLQVTQRPNLSAPQPFDSLSVQAYRVVASPAITDLFRALTFIQQMRGPDSVKVIAADSGLREFEIIEMVRSWRGTTPEKTPRTMALLSAYQDSLPRLFDFFSMEAPAAVRPRLRISYLPLAGGGLP